MSAVRNQAFRIGLKTGVILTILFLDTAQLPAATTSSNGIAPLILSGKQTMRAPGTYSPGINEVIAMLDANVDPGVILAFIQSSVIAYSPDATELIALTEHGASTEVLKALLHHGDEMRLRMAQSQSGPGAVPSVVTYKETPETLTLTYPYGYPESDDVASPNTYYSFDGPWLCPIPVYHRPRPSGSPQESDAESRMDGTTVDEPKADDPTTQGAVSASVPGEKHTSQVPSHVIIWHSRRGGRSH
jgi:hypothetical protein